jgi:hypothetical protein
MDNPDHEWGVRFQRNDAMPEDRHPRWSDPIVTSRASREDAEETVAYFAARPRSYRNATLVHRQGWVATTGEFIAQGTGDASDVATGRCCPHCHHLLTEHNVAVWNAGYAVALRHAGRNP